jgi:two-component system nitrogen regulation response regulator NtrX
MSPETILIVDDTPSILSTLAGILDDEGYDTQIAEGGTEALQMVQSALPALVLLDIWMPSPDGLEVLRRLQTIAPDLPVIMMSGHGSIETAVKTVKMGAYDYLEKPISMEKLLILVKHAIDAVRLKRENVTLKNQMGQQRQMVGEGPAMLHLREEIARAAPTQSRVLISGENGTGKELVAREIHAGSPRRSALFVGVNCAALPEGLIESELFGYEKSAFTGAQRRKQGQIELAHGGTLFLDEIADMGAATQAKLLRVLQEQAFYRLGGEERISVDVRVIAASNKDLAIAIKNGTFREDLYYRLNVVPIHLPPLRERREDIPMLVEHFIKEIFREQGIRPKTIGPEVADRLSHYAWPGNIRELRNLVERLMIMTPTPGITVSDLPTFMRTEAASTPAPWPKSLKEARRQFERQQILAELEAHHWRVQNAAEVLGIDRTHIYRKMRLLNIVPPEGM